MAEDGDNPRVGFSIKLSGSKSYYSRALGPLYFVSSLKMEKIEMPDSKRILKIKTGSVSSSFYLSKYTVICVE